MTRTTTRRIRRWVLALAAVPLVIAALLVIAVPTLAGASAYGVQDGAGSTSRADGTLVVLHPVLSEDVRVGDVVGVRSATGDLRFGAVSTVDTDDAGLARWRVDGSRGWVSEDDLAGSEWYSMPVLGHLASVVDWLPGGAAAALVLLALAAVCGSWLAAFRARRRRVPVVIQVRSANPEPAPSARPTVVPSPTSMAQPASPPPSAGAARLDA